MREIDKFMLFQPRIILSPCDLNQLELLNEGHVEQNVANPFDGGKEVANCVSERRKQVPNKSTKKEKTSVSKQKSSEPEMEKLTSMGPNEEKPLTAIKDPKCSDFDEFFGKTTAKKKVKVQKKSASAIEDFCAEFQEKPKKRKKVEQDPYLKLYLTRSKEVRKTIPAKDKRVSRNVEIPFTFPMISANSTPIILKVVGKKCLVEFESTGSVQMMNIDEVQTRYPSLLSTYSTNVATAGATSSVDFNPEPSLT